MVESVAHGTRKFAGYRTKAICLGTTGGQVSPRIVTPCPRVTKECDFTPLLITRGNISKVPMESNINYHKYYWRHDAT